MNLVFNTKRYKTSILILFMICSGSHYIFSQKFLNYRDHFQLVNWQFIKGDKHNAESPNLNTGTEWQDITVPHTWNDKDVLTRGADCYQGIAWYRCEFNLSQTGRNERYFIRFEGVCNIWVSIKVVIPLFVLK